ncbi:hypothetical protein L2E82_25573 [Cichorium intybus]|uniref:Uncharacterized protein n=1 Tax=Cichorium intybus TaxID=13427 RepID=A0ACB9E3F2_CICIN|nr:hypothetical protein L2E82_25573 [Cichorium intybus]
MYNIHVLLASFSCVAILPVGDSEVEIMRKIGYTTWVISVECIKLCMVPIFPPNIICVMIRKTLHLIWH